MRKTMIETSTSRVYDAWSWCYDKTFGALVANRQRRAVEQLRFEPGDTVLDIGVGTGMLLPLYPRTVRVVAMDLSAGMLARAAEKVGAMGLSHVQLLQADAMLPPLAEQSFDHIVITHTISVVSQPNLLLQWAARLLKPGGRIVVLNHFQSTVPVLALLERALNPLFVQVGWRSDLSIEEALHDVPLDVEYCFKLRLIDLWKILVLTHARPQGSPEAAPRPLLPEGIFQRRRRRLAFGQ